MSYTQLDEQKRLLEHQMYQLDCKIVASKLSQRSAGTWEELQTGLNMCMLQS